MDPLTFYVDEDAMDSDLVNALRARGVEITTASDAGLVGKDDEEQLGFAAKQNRVLYTFNVSDFYRLHAHWIAIGREHAGILMGVQQRFSVGEQLHRILRIRFSQTAAGMRNRVEFLGNWGDSAE